ncbi:MAG: RNA 2',3'-cyclic phosphodiesterase [Dehalococcoidia bacterium]|nr:RNA 2',3'-cyclic phosphodiesterase [Dehalococcoidia bacterium]
MTATGEQAIRSFVAIELPTEVRHTLADIQARLRVASGGIRWVAPEGVHLTLKFLGSVPASTVGHVGAALAAALESASPIPLVLGGLGAFPHWRAPRVIWTGLAGDLAALAALQSQVEEALAPLGFRPEPRPYSPHLTLGRVKNGVRPENLRPLAQAAQGLAAASTPFRASRVTLFQSTLTPAGAVYAALAQVELGTRPYGH